MSDLAEDLAGLVDTVVRPLVDVPEDLDITSSFVEDDLVLVEISVNEEDTGKVIGRQGRVIKAVRTLARALASRDGASADVEIVE